MDRLAIVVPCYNEEEALSFSITELKRILKDFHEKGKISPDSFLLLVDDGSKDRTWEIIEQSNKVYYMVLGLFMD